MAALGEQQPHLLPSDLVPNLEAVDPVKASAHPATRRLTPTFVIAGQIRRATMSCVEGGHLTDQIVIAMAGRQLVQAHRHTDVSRQRVGRRSRTLHSVQGVCGTSNPENWPGYASCAQVIE